MQSEVVVLERWLAECLEAQGVSVRMDAIRFGLIQALVNVREHVLFPEGPAAVARVEDEALAREVERSFLAYLQAAGDSA